jgi:very-short-patch-repair endonuclease
MTDAERRLWSRIRDRRLDGWKFRNQASVGPYVADFLCWDARLIVEVDGGQHSQDVDAERTRALTEMGYRVVRFWNNDVLQNTDGVLQALLLILEEQGGKRAPRRRS